MLWKKEKPKKPFGVCLTVDVNIQSLDKVVKESQQPTIEDMSEAWLSYNCTRFSFDIVALNSVNDSVLFMHGADNRIYRDMEFDIKLPLPVGPNKTDTLQVVPTGDLIFILVDEIVVMAFPTIYIANSLTGAPLAEFSDARKGMFGESEEIEISITSSSGNYKLPVISTVSKEWFKYQNTAIKVMSSPIVSDEDFPLILENSVE